MKEVIVKVVRIIPGRQPMSVRTRIQISVGILPKTALSSVSPPTAAMVKRKATTIIFNLALDEVVRQVSLTGLDR